jgi:hypothetical protein
VVESSQRWKKKEAKRLGVFDSVNVLFMMALAIFAAVKAVAEGGIEIEFIGVRLPCAGELCSLGVKTPMRFI